MTMQEKALILLESVDEVHTVASYMEKRVLNKLMEGLKKIEEEERRRESHAAETDHRNQKGK